MYGGWTTQKLYNNEYSTEKVQNVNNSPKVMFCCNLLTGFLGIVDFPVALDPSLLDRFSPHLAALPSLWCYITGAARAGRVRVGGSAAEAR